MFNSKKAAIGNRIFAATLAAVGIAAATQNLNADAFLFDFGAAATPTTGGQASAPVYWNDVPASIGGTDFGAVAALVLTNGTPTDITLQMVSRFNGANANGTTAPTQYPVSATSDSLFGNTEVFNGLENVTPIFQLMGLDMTKTYTLTFYASRTGVGDNRETRYTVTGAAELTRDLQVANNVSTTVSTTPVTPDASGNITIALSPSPNNNNANHFIYLGVLQIDISGGGRILVDFGADGTQTMLYEPVPSPFWNNVTDTIGTNPSGTIAGLVTTNGTATTAGFSMVARFNAANSAGVTTSTNYPATATQDSLFGNTEAFSGLSNIRPEFKLTGLDPAFVYTFTFFASRNGVTDNRTARYTATGANSAFGELNASNNTNNTVTVSGVRPTAGGEIDIALTPAAANNNANHFVYIGVMKVDFKQFRLPRLLFDFGADGRPTTPASDPDNAWNNVPAAIGGNSAGVVPNVLLTDGTPTTINLQMVSRFNGANENGTEASTLPYPLDATRDSLFGNTEIFSGLENITPIFKLTGLAQTNQYDILLYASRMGVGDVRETRYTITASSVTTLDLNVANNENEFVTASHLIPTAAGEITVALTPGPNNDNAFHFVYLGILQVDWLPAPARPTLSEPSYAGGVFRFRLSGTPGSTYKILRTRDFVSGWSEVAPSVTLTSESQFVTVPQTEAYYFYQVVLQQ